MHANRGEKMSDGTGIYTVTVIADLNGSSRRVWGYTLGFEEAEKAILNNTGDLFECYYQYAVIENTPPGVPTWGYGRSKVMGWYRATYNGAGSIEIVSCPCPKSMENTSGFAMG